MQYLLNILHDEGLNVPKSVYLLKKKTVKKTTVKVCKRITENNEKYFYINLKGNIANLLKSCALRVKKNYNSLSLAINVDGLPLFRSSPVNIWPVLCKIRNLNCTKIFPLGCFIGIGKPDFNELMKPIIDELCFFKDNFVDVNGSLFKVNDVIFICDSPARASLLKIKSHNSYKACQYCRIEGHRLDNKIVFPFCENLPPSRTDLDYSLGLENNQIGNSNVFKVSSYVNEIPPEYMHSVVLGVFKRVFLTFCTTN